MGCFCDALQNERERKGEANMNRLIGSEINVSLDEQNINKEFKIIIMKLAKLINKTI